VTAPLPHPDDLRKLGLLARQIGHDFNNYLSSILGYATLIKSKSEPDDPRHRYAGMIELAGNEAGASVLRLLTFGRTWTTPASRMPVDIAILQEEICKILQGGANTPVADVEIAHAKEGAKVAIDLRLLQSALEALAANACEAQPEGETPRIRVAYHCVEESALPTPPVAHAPSGRWFEIAIADPGRGMDAETLAQAALPGFTTHSGARRQGLGLPTALGFAHAHGGAMDIDSAPGKGTTVTLWLPIQQMA
jgi:signal transduction histidine kinase